MAGGGQGGGGRPAVGGNPQQYQGMLQNYRQGMAGAPSQVPGANVAAPGGGMAQTAVMPQGMGNMVGDMRYRPPGGMGAPQPAQQLNPFAMSAPGMGGGPQIQPPQGGQGWVSGGPYIPPGGMGTPQPAQQLNPFANVPQQPQGPISVGAYQPQAQPQPMPRPMPRPMPMPQVQGNPNATPLQRPQPQARGQMLRGRR